MYRDRPAAAGARLCGPAVRRDQARVSAARRRRRAGSGSGRADARCSSRGRSRPISRASSSSGFAASSARWSASPSCSTISSCSAAAATHDARRPGALLLEMAALKLPHTAQDVMPFAVLFGTMLAFWRLTRSNELVVARAAGVSVWRFLTPAIAGGAADRDCRRHDVQPDRLVDGGQLRKARQPRSCASRPTSRQPVEFRAVAAPERCRRRPGHHSRRASGRRRTCCCSKCQLFFFEPARRVHLAHRGAARRGSTAASG